MKPTTAFFFILSLVASGSGQATKPATGLQRKSEPLTPRAIAQRAFASVVLLTMEDDHGQPLSLGSGFFVRDDLVATNLHVLSGATRGHAKLVGRTETFKIDDVVQLDESDLALLRLPGAKVAALKVSSDEPAVGDEVYVVGNPQGLEGTFSQGIVSGIRNFDELKVLQITAPISPGSSGGPVLNSKGEIVGIATATIAKGQNLNFALPMSYLRRALRNLDTLSFEPLAVVGKTVPNRPGLGDSDTRIVDAISGETLLWEGFTGHYSFSLRNLLPDAVTQIYCLVIFYEFHEPINPLLTPQSSFPVGEFHTPVHSDSLILSDVIAPGLARRFRAVVDGSVRNLNTPTRYLKAPDGYNSPKGKVEIRILDFRIVR